MAADNTSGKVLGYVFGSPQAIVEFFVTSRPSFQNDAPLTCKLQASDDTTTGLDGTWTDVSGTVTFSAWSAAQTQRSTLPTTDQTPNYALASLTLNAPAWTGASGVNQSVTYSLPALVMSAPSWRVLAPGRVAELETSTLAAPASAARVAEVEVSALASPGGSTIAEIEEIEVGALTVPTTETVSRTEEIEASALAYMGPCATNRCQVWKITRKDGQVFAFTSLDTDLEWLGTTYKSCRSLTASAAHQSSELGSVGDQELSGVLDDAAIAAADLYAGLFDDAFVEVWVVPWDGQPDDQAPFRLVAGWTGKVTRQEWAFQAEVVGPGGRLQQTAVCEIVTPGCRWAFGVLDGDGIGCPVDAGALKASGLVVTGQQLRALVTFSGSMPGGSAIWNGGKVIWTSGRNAGVACQTNTVDWGSDVLSLWDLAPYAPAAGDTFDLYPGCPKTKPACLTYAVYDSFGGFPDVPGPDSLQSNADSLFT